jgi:hypothetical protein
MIGPSKTRRHPGPSTRSTHLREAILVGGRRLLLLLKEIFPTKMDTQHNPGWGFAICGQLEYTRGAGFIAPKI